MANMGVKITTRDGSVQVDSEYANLYISRYASVRTTISYYRDGHDGMMPKSVYYSRPVETDEPPLVMMRVTSGSVGFCFHLGGPGNWTGFSVVAPLTGKSVTVRFKYEAYSPGDYDDLVMTGDMGLKVFNSEGKKVFDSRGIMLSVNQASMRDYSVNYNSSARKLELENNSITISSSEMIDCSTIGGCAPAGGPGTWSAVLKVFLKAESNGVNRVVAGNVAFFGNPFYERITIWGFVHRFGTWIVGPETRPAQKLSIIKSRLKT